MEKWAELQQEAISRIRAMGYDVEVSGPDEDYSGFDCTVISGTDIKKVDVKAVRNLDHYDTVLLSLLHSTKHGGWDVPKYFSRRDVYVWIVPIDSEYLTAYELNPERLSNIELYTKGTMWKTDKDYFDRKHLLAIVSKDDTYQIFRGSNLYGYIDGKKKGETYKDYYAEKSRFEEAVVDYIGCTNGSAEWEYAMDDLPHSLPDIVAERIYDSHLDEYPREVQY